MLSALALPVINAITGSLFSSAEGIFKAYFDKQISKEEALAHMAQALTSAFKDVEVAYANSISSTFASFMGAVKESKVLQIGWLSVVLSQTLVLIIHQLVVPYAAMVGWITAAHPWRSGTTIEYAYLLLSVALGAGAIALKAGSGGGYADSLRGLIKR